MKGYVDDNKFGLGTIFIGYIVSVKLYCGQVSFVKVAIGNDPLE